MTALNKTSVNHMTPIRPHRALFSTLAVAITSACMLCSQVTAAECNYTTGINLAGPEFGSKNIPGIHGTNYIFPDTKQMAYFRDVGFQSIRLPILWERIQPVLNGPLDMAYLSLVIKALNDAASMNMGIVIDLHNYGFYRGKQVGTAAVPAKAVHDVWRRIALAVRMNPGLLAYGLMNEPHDDQKRWLTVAQSAVNGVRSADMTHDIYVSGEGWSNAHRWQQFHDAPFVVDPAGKEVYEAHLYLDADASGRYVETTVPTNLLPHTDYRLKSFIDWLAKHGKRGVIGEWGVPTQDSRWFPAAERVLAVAKQRCISTFAWAGGAWWGADYSLTLSPVNGVDRLLATSMRQWILTYRAGN